MSALLFTHISVVSSGVCSCRLYRLPLGGGGLHVSECTMLHCVILRTELLQSFSVTTGTLRERLLLTLMGDPW